MTGPTKLDALPPSKIVKAQVIAALLQGMTVADAAGEVGVRPSTISNWKAKDAEFIEMMEGATDEVATTLIEDGVVRAVERAKDLLPKAWDVIERNLKSKDQRISAAAAKVVIDKTQPKTDAARKATSVEGVARGLRAVPASGD